MGLHEAAMRCTHTLAMASLWLELLKTYGLTSAVMACAACKAKHRVELGGGCRRLQHSLSLFTASLA